MFQSIIEDVKRQFQTGNTLTRIILVNLFFFLAINIIKFGFILTNAGELPELYRDIVHFFCLSNHFTHNLQHFWVLITHFFFHEGLSHIFWNMLLLYWFGRIVGDLIGDRKILPLYLLGGLSGALFYLLGMKFFGPETESMALGASAAVLAMVTAAGVLSPHYEMNLILVGPVKLMYICGAIIFMKLVMDSAGIANTSGAGSYFGHAGGIFMGWFFVFQSRNYGRDLSAPINNLIDKIQNFGASLRTDNDRPIKSKRKKKSNNEPLSFSHQERVDQILDKIKQTGYDSLTSEEKEFLFLASKK